MTRDVIVLLPGIGGSRLERDGKAIYDLTVLSLPRLIWNWVGGDLAYTGGSGKPDDGVVATDLFNNQYIPGFFGVDDYDGLCATLRSVVANPAQQFFKFPYDWRASNRWAAEALDAFIRPKLHAWNQGGGGGDAKLWLVAHSMGGLVARYFLEHLGGACDHAPPDHHWHAASWCAQGPQRPGQWAGFGAPRFFKGDSQLCFHL